MHIVLTILNFIWIALLVLLALLLTVILLVLFVPVVYVVKARADEGETVVNFKISWLLGFFRIKGGYDKAQGFDLKGRLLFFDIMKEKKTNSAKAVKKHENTDKGRNETADKTPEDKAVGDTAGGALEDKTVSNTAGKAPEDKAVRNAADKETDNRKQCSAGKAKGIADRLGGIWQKIKNAKALWDQEEIKIAVSLLWTEFKKLIVSILPKRLRIAGRLGFENPANTGSALAFYSVIYPFTGKNIKLKFEFEDEVIDIDGYAKGRITVFRILRTGLKIYFDRNFKYLLKHVM